MWRYLDTPPSSVVLPDSMLVGVSRRTSTSLVVTCTLVIRFNAKILTCNQLRKIHHKWHVMFSTWFCSILTNLQKSNASQTSPVYC